MNTNSADNLYYPDQSLYWEKRFTGVAHLNLFTDFEVNNDKRDIAKIDFNIPVNVISAFKSRTSQAIPYTDVFTSLLTCFKILLYRYTGQSEICVGCSNNFDFKLVPLLNTVNGTDTFNSLLQQVDQNLAAAYKHIDIPFEYMDDNKPFQVIFNFNKIEKLEELYPIAFSLFENTEGIQAHIKYDAFLYHAETINRMTGHYLQLIDAIISTPPQTTVQEINILSKQEKDQLFNEFNAYADYPLHKTAIDLFKQHVYALPNNAALLYEDEQLTYKQLDKRSNKLAHYLRSLGAKPEVRIAICIERGMNMIIGMLGILKSGAAYVPVDPEYPAERINYILNDSNCQLIVSSDFGVKKITAAAAQKVINLDTDHQLINRFASAEVNHNLTQDNLAYIIYTSGSTGKPKGVMIEHRGLSNMIFNYIDFINPKPGLRALQFASFSFDGSCHEIFNTLCCGGTLVLINNNQILSSSALQQVIKKHKVEMATLPPSYQQVVMDNILDLKILYSAGEPLNLATGKHIQQQGIKLINGYGPTENTVAISFSDNPIVNGKAVIGKPLKNVQVFILDANRQLVPIGVTGELYVGGVQLARGYWQREQLTAERFVANPFSEFPGSKLYKTGDLARWLPDGNLDYIGRIDEQVKIRGYRIELGEIESVIEKSGWVKQAVVVCKTDHQDTKRLVSYVIPADNYDHTELLCFLKSQLPDYMVPYAIIEQYSFPLTPNGKIDRKLLTNLDIQPAKNFLYTPPRNELEYKLAGIWQKILGVEQIGVHDNFFDLGGSSLLALRIITDTEELTGQPLTVGGFYDHPTIAGFSSKLACKNNTNKNSLVLMKKGGDKLPFYMVHAADGNLLNFKHFIELLDDDQPVYGLQNVLNPADKPLTMEETASKYIAEILTQNPSGPFIISGYSLGGCIAFEMAKQMRQMNLKVNCVILFDSVVNLSNKEINPETTRITYRANHFLRKMIFNTGLLFKKDTYPRMLDKVLKKPEEYPMQMQKLMSDQISACLNYRLAFYREPVVLFRAKKVLRYRYDSRYLGWKSYVKFLKIYEVEGIHRDIFKNSYVKSFAKQVQEVIDHYANS